MERSLHRTVHFEYQLQSDRANQKETWSVFDAKVVVKKANIPVLDYGLFSRAFQWERSKLFRSEKRMYRVECRENNKAQKNKKEWSMEKYRNGSTHKKKTSPNFGLCACAKAKYCTLLHENSLKFYHSVRKCISSKV